MNDAPQAEAIAATLRIAQANEELRSRPCGLALEVLEGIDAGLHKVEGDELSVGRGALCDITLRDSSVSEFHFRLTVGTDAVMLEDLGSSNGVWIGRAQVKRASLLPGARFRAGAVRMQLREINTAPSAVARSDDFYGVRGCSEAMRSLFSLLGRIAPTPLPVLLCGETGVGKGQAARALHRASGRAGRFVTVDCTALPYEMADGLLFGHVKGAFTGAMADRRSPFEDAEGGTLFLDEIGELPLDLQPKLLRAIDERTVQRLGANDPQSVDVRIIAATNRDVIQEISAGRFRSDLYHRIAGWMVRIPPLRSRPEDIPFLAAIFLSEICANIGNTIELGTTTIDALERRDWPGNVRELRQTIERSAYLSDGPQLSLADPMSWHDEDREIVPTGSEQDRLASGCTPSSGGPLKPLVDAFKRDYCRDLLSRSENVASAAREAGFSVRGFQIMLSKLGLRAQDYIGSDT